MENFADFIVDYIETNEIHGHKGWLNQLHAYEWEANSRVEKYPDAIATTKKFNTKSQAILKIPNTDENWFHLCDEIRAWGGMKKVPMDIALSLRNSVIFLSKNNPGINCDFSTLPIRGDRIATASKIYYYADPLRWTIYDSRVGFAFHQLIIEYARKNGVEPSSVFQEIPLCLPDSQTTYPNSKIKKRVPLYELSDFPLCGSETRAKASFIWASYLHRLISIKLNEKPILKPDQSLSTDPQWELPHVEMVFFVIGDRPWIKAPEISTQNVPQILSGKHGDIIGPCPLCGHPVKIRKSKVTGELYEGCTNFPVCRYKGNRSH